MAKKKTSPKKTLDENKINRMTAMLKVLLSSTFVLYVKTLNFHWNMRGAQFFLYHRLLEEQYKELSEGIDDMAERMRQLGRYSPGSMQEFLENSYIKEEGPTLSQEEMVRSLVRDNEALEESIHSINHYADTILDQGTSDLLNERIRAHSKNAWLLRSHLEK